MAENDPIHSGRLTIQGTPLHPLEGDDVEIAEGRLGNSTPLNDDDIFDPDTTKLDGRDFYLLVAGTRGHTAQDVAWNLTQHLISIRPFEPDVLNRACVPVNIPGPLPPNESSVEVGTDHPAYRYLDREASRLLRFRPDLIRLRAIYGENVDFFMVPFHLQNDREALFGRHLREVPPSPLLNPFQPENPYRHSIRYDLIQRSAEGACEVSQLGGLAIFDRQDPDQNQTPGDFSIVILSDLHLADRNDIFAERVMDLPDPSQILRFNNANANFFDAIIPWLNVEAQRGHADLVVTLGDNIDYDGRDHEHDTSRHNVHNLLHSNNYFFAKGLARILPPVVAGLGNHEVLGEGAPASLTPENFNLNSREVRTLESDRYDCDINHACQLTLNGLYVFLQDATNAILYDPNTLISFYDTINPFHDLIINLGRGNPGSREARFLLMDMGGGDLSHFRQDDPIYDELQVWYWNLPFLHIGTIWDTFRHSSPDVRGPTYEQLSWMAAQGGQLDSNNVLLMHPPIVNSKEHQVAFDPNAEIAPMERVPPEEDLSFNTMTHRGQALRVIADSPNLLAVIDGHAHFDGNDQMIGLGLDDEIEVYRGRFRLGLNQAGELGPDAVRYFWRPQEENGGEWPADLQTLYGRRIGNLQNTKVTWQVGAAGVTRDGNPPVFTRITLNPDGLISHEDHFYINKYIVHDETDRNQYSLELKVEQMPRRNDRLVEEWASIRWQNPQAYLDLQPDRNRAQDRLNTDDTSFVPSSDSLWPYPRYNEVVDHPLISPTDMNSYVRLHTATDFFYGISQASLQYFLSEGQIGPIWRNLAWEGLEAGWFRSPHGNQNLFAAWRIPPVFDWMPMRDHQSFIIRGIGLGLGLEFPVWEATPASDLRMYNHLNLFEVNFEVLGLGMFLGLDYHNIFKGTDNWWLTAGLSLAYPDNPRR